MIIPKSKFKIVHFDENSVSTIPALATFVKVVDPCDGQTTRRISGSGICSSYWHVDRYAGIYFGHTTDLEALVTSKKYTLTNATKTLYFDTNCKYPRYKVSEYSTFKKKLNPVKADCCVISKINIDIDYLNVGPNGKGWGDLDQNKLTKQVVMYSAKEDMYYLIWDTETPKWNSMATRDRTYNKFLQNNGFTTATYTLAQYVSDLAQWNIIPQDCKQVYIGTITAIPNNLYTTIENICNTYMQVIYDTELDAFISQTLKIMDAEDIKTLTTMLSSKDGSVVAMGIKLLATYNIQERICTTGTMIISNWSNIRYNNVRSSVGFQNIIKQLGLDTSELTDNTYRQNKLINKLYNLSKNEDDRNACRNTILEQIKQRLMKDFENYSREFENLGMSITIEIK
jgi:hypothetical protein